MNGLANGEWVRIRAAIGGVTACAALLLVGPATASGSTRIGSTFEATFSCTGHSTYFEQSTAATSPSYTVPAGGGVITSWRTRQGAGSARMQLGLLRPAGTPSRFTTVLSSAVETVETRGLSRFDTRLPAQAGDTIAALIVSGTYDCASFGHRLGDVGQRDSAAVHHPGATFTYGDPNTGARINLAATVEPDADGDGYGDETQDLCPSDGDTLTECRAPETEITKEPKNRTTRRKVKYKFVSDKPGSSFECRYDKKPYKPCTSPRRLRAKNGKHRFRVRAIDATGNVDPTPDKDKFKAV